MPVIFLTLLLSANLFAYDCKPAEVEVNVKSSKKALTAALRKLPRDQVVQGFFFEVTSSGVTRKPKKAQALATFLIGTEVNPDKRAFFELLQTSADLDTLTPKKLELAEVCDLNGKVNSLPPAEGL